MKTKTNKDNRSPLAKARDQWLESDAGKMLCNPNILRDQNQRQFLENRLVMAFIDGANWAAGHLAK